MIYPGFKRWSINYPIHYAPLFSPFISLTIVIDLKYYVMHIIYDIMLNISNFHSAICVLSGGFLVLGNLLNAGTMY